MNYFFNGVALLLIIHFVLGAGPFSTERLSSTAFNDELQDIMNTDNHEYTLPPYYPTRRYKHTFFSFYFIEQPSNLKPSGAALTVLGKMLIPKRRN